MSGDRAAELAIVTAAAARIQLGEEDWCYAHSDSTLHYVLTRSNALDYTACGRKWVGLKTIEDHRIVSELCQYQTMAAVLADIICFHCAAKLEAHRGR